MTKEDIQKTIERMTAMVVLQGYTLGYLHSPHRRELDKLIMGINAYKATFACTSGNVDFILDDVLNIFKSENFNNVRIIHQGLMLSIIYVHDILKNSVHNKKTPEFEFFRHTRNAMSHGNRFHLLKGEPKLPAVFEGLPIDNKLHGMESVIPEYLSVARAFRLLDYIKNNL